MKFPRRRFLHLAAGAAAVLTLAPSVIPTPAQGQTAVPKQSARDRLEEALARIADPKGEGKRACLTVYSDAARAAADAADARPHTGVSLGPLDGAIVSIKDLFDVAGEPTRAGSKVLIDAPPASIDAPAVRRLRAGGAVIVAKTNMVEFAFSGIGVNPHYGTPGNPADRMRVPGGSSSGAAVAVADGVRSQLAPTRAVRPAFPPRFVVWSDTSQPNRACRPKARSRCLTHSIQSGRSRGASWRAPPLMR
jgi:aspartyl-tRNA(Asn)/glutamyl-tRNA(Gln) amidotransferase subunit A